VIAQRPLVGIFVPCHNEAEIIEDTIAALRRYLDSPDFPYRAAIIVVDDGSSDATFELARRAGADVLYRHVTNQGLGAATRAGMEIAHYIGCAAFAKFDADQQHDVEDILPSVRPLVADDADVVYASRFAGKIHYRMPLVRSVGNRVFTALMRSITGWAITDAQTGLMCFGRRYLSVFEMPAAYNPPQQALFDASRKGMRYAEVPAQFYARRTGHSFISLRYISKVTTSLLKLSFYHYCFRVFSLVGAALLLLATAFAVRGFYGYFVEGAPTYVPNAVGILLSAISGVLAVLFGLQSYAQLNRMPYIRNSGAGYRYVVLEYVTFNNASLRPASAIAAVVPF
jgi:glycosyltransferase involved in cell wall biosynthesis